MAQDEVGWQHDETRRRLSSLAHPRAADLSSYDSLIVVIVPRTRRQALVLVATTTLVTAIVGFIGRAGTYEETVHRFAWSFCSTPRGP
jgi:hypothetical protein